MVEKQNILSVSFFCDCFFFHMFYFYFFFFFHVKWKRCWLKKKNKTKCFKIHWSIYAVLLAFCIKKAKNDHTTRKHDNTRIDKTKKTRENLTKGLGVSLAKTPFEVLLQRTGEPKSRYSMAFFFLRVLFFVVFLFMWQPIVLKFIEIIFCMLGYLNEYEFLYI